MNAKVETKSVMQQEVREIMRPTTTNRLINIQSEAKVMFAATRNEYQAAL